MGLDLVEFTMEIEEAFDFRFPDEDTLGITTPRRLIDYLGQHLPAATDPVCLSQRAFYRLRQALATRLRSPRNAFRPGTPLLPIIPAASRNEIWDEVCTQVGAASASGWPRLAEPGWFDFFRRARAGTLREAALFLVARFPHVLKGDDAGWTRTQIAEVVHPLICNRFGLRRNQYTEDSRWREDMGID
jgi:hypothetical protein